MVINSVFLPKKLKEKLNVWKGCLCVCLWIFYNKIISNLCFNKFSRKFEIETLISKNCVPMYFWYFLVTVSITSESWGILYYIFKTNHNFKFYYTYTEIKITCNLKISNV